MSYRVIGAWGVRGAPAAGRGHSLRECPRVPAAAAVTCLPATRQAFASGSEVPSIDAHFPATPAELADLKLRDSQRLAEAVQRHLVRFLTLLDPEISDRGVKTAPLVVLAHAQMPAILAEVSCLSNEKDATLLQRASYRQYIADALAQGIFGFAEETSFRTEAGR